MRVHPKGVLVVIAVVALFSLALDVRLGLAAIVAATIIDWAFLAGPLVGSRRRSHTSVR